MKLIGLYLFMLFGLPLIMTIVHVTNLPDNEKLELTEAAKTLNGRIYTIRIECNKGRNDHIVRVYGQSREEARNKIHDRLERCDVEVLETSKDLIWKEALRSVD